MIYHVILVHIYVYYSMDLYLSSRCMIHTILSKSGVVEALTTQTVLVRV